LPQIVVVVMACGTQKMWIPFVVSTNTC
jgi:hypothetical protein